MEFLLLLLGTIYLVAVYSGEMIWILSLLESESKFGSWSSPPMGLTFCTLETSF